MGATGQLRDVWLLCMACVGRTNWQSGRNGHEWRGSLRPVSQSLAQLGWNLCACPFTGWLNRERQLGRGCQDPTAKHAVSGKEKGVLLGEPKLSNSPGDLGLSSHRSTEGLTQL